MAGSPIRRQSRPRPHPHGLGGRIRMALVAETAECLEAVERFARFVRTHPNKT